MNSAVNVHLIDGTYELFRGYFGAPPVEVNGKPVGAARALIKSLAAWLRTGQVTHAGIAFDHVIECFRNQLFAGYKTGEGMDPLLYQQFPLAERAAAALGLVVWPMIEFEADDALATMASMLQSNPDVRQILLTTPDKDLAQCVVADKIVTYDRHRNLVLDDRGVTNKFGVTPASIADYLALVGDTADGIPGLVGWGAKSAATVLLRYVHIEHIPVDVASWDIKVRSADKLSQALVSQRSDAMLFRTLATLRTDCPLNHSLADLQWHGVNSAMLADVSAELGITPESIKLPSAKH